MSVQKKFALWGLVFVFLWMFSIFLVLSADGATLYSDQTNPFDGGLRTYAPPICDADGWESGEPKSIEVEYHGRAMLLDFTSPYCGSCQTMAPTIDGIERDGLLVTRIDVSQPDGQRTAKLHRVTQVPTYIALDASDRECGRVVGAVPREQILAMFPPQQAAAPASSIASSSCQIRATVAGRPMETWKGSGTLIGKDQQSGTVVTCFHIFRDSVPPYFVTFPSGAKYQANLLVCDESAELATLAIAPPAEQPLPVSYTPGGILIAGGFGDDGRWRVVSGPFLGSSGQWLKMGGGMTRMGDSGGPVVNQAGELVGVAWGCSNNEVRFCGGENLRRFLSRSPAAQPMATRQPPQQRPQLPTTYQGPLPGPAPEASKPLAAAPPTIDQAKLDWIDAELKRLEQAKQDKAAAARYQQETIEAGAKLIEQVDAVKASTTTERQSIYTAIAQAKERAILAARNDAVAIAENAKHAAIDTAQSRIGEVKSEVLAKLPAAGSMAIQFTLRNILIAAGVGTGGAGVAAMIGGMVVKRSIGRVLNRKGVEASSDSAGERAWGFRFPFWRARRASQSAAKNSEGAASPAGSFPGTSGGSRTADTELRIYQPVERDTTQGEQLLQLDGREGRDPLQDAIAGGVARRRLEALADSNTDPAKAAWAKEFLVEIDRRYNEIAPTKFTPKPQT
jgi:thiol-disulfide isomerase/thioredoxin